MGAVNCSVRRAWSRGAQGRGGKAPSQYVPAVGPYGAPSLDQTLPQTTLGNDAAAEQA